MQYLLIYRNERFSPNAVERDKAMLDEVAKQIAACTTADIHFLYERELPSAEAAEYADFTVIHMTRSAEALAKLSEMQQFGTKILNAPKAIRGINRANIEKVMADNNLPTPAKLIEDYPELGGKGWWIKANDTTDSSPSHIQFYETLPTEIVAVSDDSASALLIQPNIEGKDLKFYGIRGTDFFKVREDIATDILQQLHNDANTLAAALSLDIYGGDAILTPGGQLTIIDFNDFPSFSSCREEASAAIVQLI